MLPLFASWLGVTVILAILLFMRRRLESREVDWMPLATTTAGTIRNQEIIEQKVHRISRLLHWLEAVDVLLLVSLAALWIYQGLQTVRW